MEERLLGANTSRTFYTQTLMPGAAEPDESVAGVGAEGGGAAVSQKKETLAPKLLVWNSSLTEAVDA
ncbi:hypothetical protein T484DRAFT_1801050 [Baffinella frigidus]|nr:hypothetical protein T484DRAFT_1801050 [Cryptophyta sp. CCMP2293]